MCCDIYPKAKALTPTFATVTLDKAGFSAESVARLLKEKRKRSSKEDKTVEQIYFEVKALNEGRMDGHGLHERIGEIDVNRPIWIKVHRKYLEPDTLDLYEVPWEWYEVSELSPKYNIARDYGLMSCSKIRHIS